MNSIQLAANVRQLDLAIQSKRSTTTIKSQLTNISLKLFGIPVSSSNTKRTPSGGLLTKSLTSRATRASVLGGRFSELLVGAP